MKITKTKDIYLTSKTIQPGDFAIAMRRYTFAAKFKLMLM